MNLKNKILLLFVQSYQKRKEVPYMEMTMSKKGENLLMWKNHVTVIKRDTYKSNEMQLKIILQHFSTKRITSFNYQHSISFTHGLQHDCFLGQANLYRLCGLRKCQDRFGRFSWSEIDSNYLDVKLKYSRKMTRKSSDWSKILQWEKQISTSL